MTVTARRQVAWFNLATLRIEPLEKNVKTADVKTTFIATWKGQTRQRTSTRRYTHASIVRFADGKEVIYGFHSSEALALKGSLASSQTEGGARVIAAVPLTRA